MRVKYLRAEMKLITGIILSSLLVTSAEAASFDCTRAGTKVEKLICDDVELSGLDDELNKAYRDALKDGMSKDAISDSQKNWLKERNRCSSVQCLHDSYQQRITELNENYKLVMSKDTKLCNAMLALYSGDIKASGRIKYEDHEMFKKIEWQADSQYSDLMHAIFDINNDGKKELVLRTTSGFHGIHTDHFYIYPEDSDIYSRIGPGAGGLRDLFGNPNQLFSSDNSIYNLKELQSPLTDSLGVYLVLNPFVSGETTYISMTDVRPRWIVIAKYLEAEKLQDVCYFYNKNIRSFDYSQDIFGK